MPKHKPNLPEGSPLTTAAVKQHYTRPPSFTDLLPWMEYIPESRAFLLEDGISLGALFEVQAVGCEARTPAFMTQLRDAIQTAINEAIPERDDAPWVLQIYVQEEPRLTQFNESLARYPSPAVRRLFFLYVCRAWHGSSRVREMLSACRMIDAQRSKRFAYGVLRPATDPPCRSPEQASLHA